MTEFERLAREYVQALEKIEGLERDLVEFHKALRGVIWEVERDMNNGGQDAVSGAAVLRYLRRVLLLLVAEESVAEESGS
jgi:hypothetical protein